MTKRPESTKHTQFDPAEQEREELQAKVETDHADYTPDTSADPEGAARRSEPESLSFPPWIFENYHLSRQTFWGRAHKDGAEHLIPKETVVEEAMELHTNTWEGWPEVVDRSVGVWISDSKLEGGSPDLVAEYTLLHTAFSAIIEETSDPSLKYQMVRMVGQLAIDALGARAYTKWVATDMRIRERRGVNFKSDTIERAEDRLMAASGRAAILFRLHNDLWKLAEWKNAPTYPPGMVRAAVVREFEGYARYLEQNHATGSGVSRATSRDYQDAYSNL